MDEPRIPMVFWNPPGTHPDKPENSQFTIGDTQITSGPVTPGQGFPEGSFWTSFGKIGGPHITGIFGPDGKLITTK
jgi:hypothetical protein